MEIRRTIAKPKTIKIVYKMWNARKEILNYPSK
jgi:hypothetical protein